MSLKVKRKQVKRNIRIHNNFKQCFGSISFGKCCMRCETLRLGLMSPVVEAYFEGEQKLSSTMDWRVKRRGEGFGSQAERRRSGDGKDR